MGRWGDGAMGQLGDGAMEDASDQPSMVDVWKHYRKVICLIDSCANVSLHTRCVVRSAIIAMTEPSQDLENHVSAAIASIHMTKSKLARVKQLEAVDAIKRLAHQRRRARLEGIQRKVCVPRHPFAVKKVAIEAVSRAACHRWEL